MGFGPPAGMDLFQAARAGNCSRLADLIEGGADVNAYDRWDAFPLYYACFAGHYNAARMLLDAGAIYVKSSLDGERCYRSALHLGIRGLLDEYEWRPSPRPASPAPLGPLPTAFQSAFLEINGDGTESTTTAPSDITLNVEGSRIKAHRVILAARSPYFRRKLSTEWRDLKEVTLPSSHCLPFSVMFSLVGFFYTDRLEVSADDLEAVARVCRAFEGEALHEMADRLDARRWLYRGAPTSPQRRFVLQVQPEHHGLPWDLRRILQDCLANSREDLSNNSDYDDLADTRISVGDRVFRCHRMVLSSRSSYFRARLSCLESRHNVLEEEADVSAEAFEKVLEFIYTGELEHLGDDPLARAEELVDIGPRYMVYLPKHVVGALPLPHLDLDHLSPAQMCRWLLWSCLFDIANVRDQCVDVIACNFQAFADAREFRAMLLDLGRGPLFHALRERCLRVAAAGPNGKESVAWLDERLEKLILGADEEANHDLGGFSSLPGRSRASLISRIAAGLMKILCCLVPPEEDIKDKSNV